MNHHFYIMPDEYDRAERNGIRKGLLDQRVRELGWDRERAMTEPPRKKSSIKKWAQIAEKNGISYEAFRRRIYRGMSVEEAATRPLTTRADRQRIANEARERRRVFDPEIVELAEKNGISYHTFYTRVRRRGWSEEKAATHPIMSNQEIGLMTKDKRAIGRFGRCNRG